MGHILETATDAELDDLTERLDIGLDLSSYSDAEFAALANAAPSGRHRGRTPDEIAAELKPVPGKRVLRSLAMVEILVGSGTMLREEVPLLKFLALAPGVVLSTAALRWNTALSEFVLVTETGGLRRLTRAADFFRAGSDENGWEHVILSPGPDCLARRSETCSTATEPHAAADPDAPDPDAYAARRGEEVAKYPGRPTTPFVANLDAFDATYRLQRVSGVLGAILAVVPADPTRSDRDRDRGHLKVVDLYHRWRLVARPGGGAPLFQDDEEATRAADAAILGEAGTYCWLDRHNGFDEDGNFEPCS